MSAIEPYASGPPELDENSDAISLLVADHEQVRRLFDAYDDLVEDEASDDDKEALADRICTLLSVHAAVEEEILYPAAREAIEEQDLLDEAQVEHATARDLIAQIEAMDAGEDLFDATVRVLGEYVAHHVAEEEDEIFPRLKAAGLDLQALGAELLARKEQLAADEPVDAGRDA